MKMDATITFIIGPEALFYACHRIDHFLRRNFNGRSIFTFYGVSGLKSKVRVTNQAQQGNIKRINLDIVVLPFFKTQLIKLELISQDETCDLARLPDFGGGGFRFFVDP